MRCRGDSGDAVTAFGTYPLTMQRNASLFFAEIPDDIGQLAANPDLGQMLVHEESLAFGIANDDTRHVECIFSAFNIIWGVRMFFWTVRRPVQDFCGIARGSSSPVTS